jgi:hypothetical protein
MADEIIIDMAQLITVQPPVIEERLATLKAEWLAKAAQAAALECTPSTLKTVKAERSQMRKDFEAIENQRKAALEPIRAKVDAFQTVYKECVTTPFNEADSAYKAKIADVENGIKANCERRMREYFTELVQVHNVHWLEYERAGLKIGLTEAQQATPRKLMDTLSEFVARVANDCDAISKMDDAAEIMAEYQVSLSLSGAVQTVRQRKEAIERQRREMEERQEREAQIQEAVQKVEAAATVQPPVVVEQPKQEKMLRMSFTVTATREKLVALKNYMIQEGIKYE